MSSWLSLREATNIVKGKAMSAKLLVLGMFHPRALLLGMFHPRALLLGMFHPGALLLGMCRAEALLLGMFTINLVPLVVS